MSKIRAFEDGSKSMEFPDAEQLCWNCKRCTNSSGLTCSWAESGIPVEGWTATEGREYYKYSDKGEKLASIGTSYCVTDCPLYIKDKPFSSCAEAIAEVAKVIGISPTCLLTSKKKQKKYFDRYEKITGTKLPYYIYPRDMID